MYKCMQCAIAALLMTGLCLMFTCACASTEEGGISTPPVFQLPASLRIIEDEAFEGTAIVNVHLPESVESIGEGAFANIPTLRNVRIPQRTTYIARTAFTGSDKTVITAAPNSFARTWAQENGVPFAPIIVIYAGTRNIQPGSDVTTGQTQNDADAAESAVEPDKPQQWRTVCEIKAKRYECFVADHEHTRAPPVCA